MLSLQSYQRPLYSSFASNVEDFFHSTHKSNIVYMEEIMMM
jgi:hypothetical protein